MTRAHDLSLVGKTTVGKTTGTGRTTGIAIITGALLTASAGMAGEVAPMDVKFMEDNSQVMASITGKAGDAATGRKIFSNRKQGNCLACHVNSDMKEHSFHGEVGPSLDEVAERYNEAELRAILIDSKKALNEGTIMPGFYSLDLGVRIAGKFKDKTVLKAQQIEDILAYLQTLK
ncbi:MAG: sulfur oxidation c-type cytochrome SoxX [bacterium]|nr:sulfur oxidation c-type cytochrome SoxX [bacterium]